MTITNGYATLDQLKERLLEMLSYTNTTISFTASSKTITDTAKGLRAVQSNDVIEIDGSTSNDGFYTVATVNDEGSFTVDQALTDEAAGESVTIRKSGDGFNDVELESAIEAVSRWIDDEVGRVFYTSSAATRYYTAENPAIVFTDDIQSVTSITIDTGGQYQYETTLASTDYLLRPANSVAKGKPYRWIEVSPTGRYSLPTHPDAVKVVGNFGYSSSTDKRAQEACLLLAAKLFKRKDAPFGILGNPDLGELRNIRAGDADADAMLRALDAGPLA